MARRAVGLRWRRLPGAVPVGGVERARDALELVEAGVHRVGAVGRVVVRERDVDPERVGARALLRRLGHLELAVAGAHDERGLGWRAERARARARALRDHPAAVAPEDDAQDGLQHQHRLQQHIRRAGEIEEQHERPRPGLAVVHELRHHHERGERVEEEAEEQRAVEPRPPRVAAVDGGDHRVHDACDQPDGARDPSAGEDVVQPRLLTARELRVRDGAQVAQGHLIPANRPPLPLPPEGAQVGRGELARARLGAEADLLPADHGAGRRVDVLGLHLRGEGVEREAVVSPQRHRAAEEARAADELDGGHPHEVGDEELRVDEVGEQPREQLRRQPPPLRGVRAPLPVADVRAALHAVRLLLQQERHQRGDARGVGVVVGVEDGDVPLHLGVEHRADHVVEVLRLGARAHHLVHKHAPPHRAVLLAVQRGEARLVLGERRGRVVHHVQHQLARVVQPRRDVLDRVEDDPLLVGQVARHDHRDALELELGEPAAALARGPGAVGDRAADVHAHQHVQAVHQDPQRKVEPVDRAHVLGVREDERQVVEHQRLRGAVVRHRDARAASTVSTRARPPPRAPCART
eukprot:CAMPEP_0119421942 /NCGR_PEP_ID=MMETSP1335-20130426/27032_1 /TAXON_ID=259385 /ORGANISM="Chrysoculter rhomboideus, Strain RCC1486" /LENGTH=580 /DNA_ID=CAMNT_0007447369 /DNA_START=268 /DNA_END=2007 /DNA_ORIENTATION=+